MKNKIKKQKSITYCRLRAVKTKQKRRFGNLKPLCWIIIPFVTAALLILDALNLYTFNIERLTVLGIGLLVTLLPFFNEITIKNLSIKRSSGISERNSSVQTKK